MSRNSQFDMLGSLGLLDWSAMLAGWKHGWVSREELSTFATDFLSKEDDPELWPDLSIMASSESLDQLDDSEIRALLVKMNVGCAEPNTSLDKWRLVRLLELQASLLDWDTKVTLLEELGAEFGYPDDMWRCTRYAPSDEAIRSGHAAPEDRLIDPLKEMDSVIQQLKKNLYGTSG